MGVPRLEVELEDASPMIKSGMAEPVKLETEVLLMLLVTALP